MGLRFALLGSGSSGNATVVSNGERCVLVDVGLSGRETARRLRECGFEPGQVGAVVVSHEHTDHIRGLAPFVKDLDVPVFITEGALSASELKIDPRKTTLIEAGAGFEVCGLHLTPFSVPHDSADPLAFTVESGGVKLGIVMDLGEINQLAIERMNGCDAIILESNHDLNMLQVGPYPWALKQRIKGRLGHLSNDDAAEYLAGRFDGRARDIVLAHLSEKNNLPEIALLSARRALEERGPLRNCQTRLQLARPDRVSESFNY